MDPITSNSNEDQLKILLEWRKLYAEALIDALKPTENVLQIGFCHGFAAECIQKHHPKTHIIIEANPEVVEKATTWVNGRKNIKVIQGKWEDVLATIGSFETIFFHDYPSPDHDISIMNFLFPEHTLKASNEAKKLLSFLEEQMSKLTVKFTDQDIEDFYQKIGRSNPNEMPAFFKKLKDNKNISDIQYEKYKKYFDAKQHEQLMEPNPKEIIKKADNMLEFLEECLKNHMMKGSRFSAFLNSQKSKYEDSQFFDNIITNTDIDFQENFISIKTSDKTREALVILVEKSF